MRQILPVRLLCRWGDRFPVATYSTIFPESPWHIRSWVSCRLPRALSHVLMYDLQFPCSSPYLGVRPLKRSWILLISAHWPNVRIHQSRRSRDPALQISQLLPFLQLCILSHFHLICYPCDQNPKKKRGNLHDVCACIHTCVDKQVQQQNVILSEILLTNFPTLSELTTNNRIAWKILGKT